MPRSRARPIARSSSVPRTSTWRRLRRTAVGLKVVGAMVAWPRSSATWHRARRGEPAGMTRPHRARAARCHVAHAHVAHAHVAHAAHVAPSPTSPSMTSLPPSGDRGFQRTVAGLAQSMNATMSASLSSRAPPLRRRAHDVRDHVRAPQSGTMPTSMTAAAPAATVLPHVTLQPTSPSRRRSTTSR